MLLDFDTIIYSIEHARADIILTIAAVFLPHRSLRVLGILLPATAAVAAAVAAWIHLMAFRR